MTIDKHFWKTIEQAKHCPDLKEMADNIRQCMTSAEQQNWFTTRYYYKVVNVIRNNHTPYNELMYNITHQTYTCAYESMLQFKKKKLIPKIYDYLTINYKRG